MYEKKIEELTKKYGNNKEMYNAFLDFLADTTGNKTLIFLKAHKDLTNSVEDILDTFAEKYKEMTEEQIVDLTKEVENLIEKVNEIKEKK